MGAGAGSFVSRVEGVPTGALLDPERPTVAWFGSHQAELESALLAGTLMVIVWEDKLAWGW